MITEDYCSFEVAKLLNEKGFDVECETSYYISNEGCENAVSVGDFTKVRPWREALIAAPTHQMAMKWLREEYKIAINIRIVCKKTISYAFDIWDFEIIHPNKFVGGTIDLREQQFDFNSYEETIEEALNYCLENLI